MNERLAYRLFSSLLVAIAVLVSVGITFPQLDSRLIFQAVMGGTVILGCLVARYAPKQATPRYW